MLLSKVNQDASLAEFLADGGSDGRVAPIMATPGVVVVTSKWAVAAAGAYVVTKNVK
ncbi:hypothetical protein ACFWZR_03955 [Streptomyces sp. NPDC059017]|uniref:hypothetical protein n=1 Tax=unclassified Streptomyces TaxID=2593676 RepID=UPI003418222E